MTLDCVRRPVVVITANVRMGEEKERGIEGGKERKGRGIFVSQGMGKRAGEQAGVDGRMD